MADAKKKTKYVIVKLDKFATVGGGLGAKPKVYNTMKAAQFDIDSNTKLKGASIRPYGGEDGTVSTSAGATTTKTKAAVAKTATKAGTPAGAAATKAAAKTNTPKRAAAGK
jgi:hypothetical protein